MQTAAALLAPFAAQQARLAASNLAAGYYAKRPGLPGRSRLPNVLLRGLLAHSISD